MNREWRNTRRVGWFLGILLGLVFVVLLTNSCWQGWRLERLQRAQLAQGEVLDWRRLVPRHVDLASNGGDEFIAAMEVVPTDVTRASRVWFWTQEGTGRKVAISLEELPGRFFRDYDEYWASNLWIEASRRLEPWEESLVLASRALTNEFVLRRVNYSELEERRESSQIACWVAYVEWQRLLAVIHLRKGDRAAALQVLKNGYGLIVKCADERVAYFQNRRVYMASVLSGAIWEILQHDGWTDAELASLQRLLDRPEFVEPILPTLEMGRADIVKMWERDSVYDWLGRDPTVRVKLLNHVAVHAGYFIWKTQFAAADLRTCLSLMQGEMNAARAAIAQRSAEPFLLTVNKESPRWVPGFRFTNCYRFRLQRLFWMLIAAETEREMCRAAIGLRRFRQAHGHYPMKLVELVPGYVPAVPRDWFDGEALRYERKGDEYRLWAVGEDGIDEGGNPGLDSRLYHWFGGKDWLWPRRMSPKGVVAHTRTLEAEWRKWAKRHP